MKSIFRTILEPNEWSEKVSFGDGIFLIGSCFAEKMGVRFQRYKFDICLNPFGILFNPESIATALEMIIQGKQFSIDDLDFDGSLYHSFYHHGRFSGKEPQSVIDEINRDILIGKTYLEKSRFLLVTFGSAWVYEEKVKQRIVANCHKFPNQNFLKRLLTHDEIVNSWNQLLGKLRNFNPDVRVVFSVSPVRYLKDGFAENQLSKSHLLIAANQLSEHGGVQYFPSYEIFMDDLRDYRFCSQDMVHPSADAVQYIWEKLLHSAMDYQTTQLLDSLEKYLLLAEHRSMHESEEEKMLRLDKSKRGIEMLISGYRQG
ncbi:MAG: GSCFA domain-containing protein [Flavobacteriales bacterium]|nr:GSCFA domain-containing protein [Flavobacteriales bacterium]